MKLSTPAALTLLATIAATAQEAPSKTRFGISYRSGWNVKGSFSGIGRSPPQSNPGPRTGGVNHEYDDGYGRVDSTNNGLDLRWMGLTRSIQWDRKLPIKERLWAQDR